MATDAVIEQAYAQTRLNGSWLFRRDRSHPISPLATNREQGTMTNEGKRLAKYTAVGALLGIPLPIIGPVIGGVIGAVLGARKNQRVSGRAY
jgi:hypothetical protein